MKCRKAIFLLFLTFSISCSSNSDRQIIYSASPANQINTPSKIEENSPVPANSPVTCEKFTGDWFAAMFIDIEDEKRMICDGKPCWRNVRGANRFRLSCKKNKIVGEVILVSGHSHNEANTAIFKPTPQTFQEIKTPIKESRIENGSLFLSYIDRRECLSEINVVPKGEFLFGKYTDKDCKRLTSFDGMGENPDIKIKDQTGGILFINQESKNAF